MQPAKGEQFKELIARQEEDDQRRARASLISRLIQFSSIAGQLESKAADILFPSPTRRPLVMAHGGVTGS